MRPIVFLAWRPGKREMTVAGFARSGFVLLAVVLVGCSSATPTAAPGSSEVPTPAGVASAAATSVAPPTPGPTATPTATAQATPGAVALARDSVAVTAATSLVLRSKPEVSEASQIFKPSLSKGDQVFVVAGPVYASGYDWYDVNPLSAKYMNGGWVAAASRAGEPWIVPAVATCPPIPTTFAQLTALTDGQRLACFSRVPITVRARVIRFIGSVDPGMAWVPAWFGQMAYELRDPTGTAPSTVMGPLFFALDPAGTHPDPLPEGKVVTVTGIFDHPGAAGCTVQLADEQPEPTDSCRSKFAVTAMK
jgi:hypothetical protein